MSKRPDRTMISTSFKQTSKKRIGSKLTGTEQIPHRDQGKSSILKQKKIRRQKTGLLWIGMEWISHRESERTTIYNLMNNRKVGLKLIGMEWIHHKK